MSKTTVVSFLAAAMFAWPGCTQSESATSLRHESICIDALANDADSERKCREPILHETTGGDVCKDDASPPVVTTHDIVLWPPNHRLHAIALSDCIDSIDDCDPDVTVDLMWVSSDEPEDDHGDGHTAPDITDLTPDGVFVRGERDGRKDGRVYTLGFGAVDTAGNVTEGTCHVVVPHDNSGRPAIDSGEAYHLDVP